MTSYQPVEMLSEFNSLVFKEALENPKITPTTIGLDKVENTSDLNKPISTLTQAALDLKAPLNNPSFTGIVSGISQTMVGLDKVNNTPDAEKPISTSTQNALALKAPLDNPSFTGFVSGISATMVGLDKVNNTPDAEKPISTLTQNALALKAPLNNPSFTGNLTISNNLTINNGITLNPSSYGASISFPSSMPTTISDMAGLGITWNQDQVGSGRTNFIGYGQGGNGGFSFTSLGNSSSFPPVTNVLINGSGLFLYGPLNSTATINTTNVGGITSRILNLADYGGVSTAYYGQIYQQDAGMTIKSISNNGVETKIYLVTTDTAGNSNTTLTLSPNYLYLNGNVYCPNGLGIYGNAFQAQSDTNPVSLATNLTSGSGLTIGSSYTPTSINGSSITMTGTVSGITQSMVGLPNVNNTSDADKIISTLTQTALDAKAPLNNPTFTGNVSGITQSMVGLANVNNTSDLNKPISTAVLNSCATFAGNNIFTGSNTMTSTLGVGNTITSYDNTQTVNTSYSTTITQAAEVLQIKSRNALATTPNQTTIQFMLEDPGHNLPVVMELNSNTIKIYKPIQLSYSSFTTPAITYVGGLFTGTYITILPTSGITKSIVSMAMPIGVWAFSGNISYNATNIVSSKLAIVEYYTNSFSSPAVTKTQTVNASSMCDNISTILPVPNATTYYLTVLLNFSGTLTTTSDNLPFLRATRLA